MDCAADADRSGELRYPFAPRTFLQPAESLNRLRDRAPICKVALDGGDEAWLVTRYAEGHAALVDPRLAIWFPGMPRDSVLDDEAAGFVFVMNGPAHLRLRRKLGSALGGEILQRVRRRAERVAGQIVAKLVRAGEPADVVSEVGVPLATGCLRDLLGVSEELARDLGRRAVEAAGVFAPPGSEQATTAEAAFADWVAEALDAEEAGPGRGLLSALLRDTSGDPLRRDEVSNAVLALLLGGLVPPARALAHGLLRLEERPDVIQELVNQPDLMPAVVEELLRLDHAVASSALRLATEDLEVGAVPVAAGEIVVVSLGAVNRDPSRFPKPDMIDPHRTNLSHLSFTAGPHRCLGAGVARAQLVAGLRATYLVATPHHTADETQRWRPGYFTDLPGITALTTQWHPARLQRSITR